MEKRALHWRVSRSGESTFWQNVRSPSLSLSLSLSLSASIHAQKQLISKLSHLQIESRRVF